MTIKTEYYQYPSSLTVERNYETDMVTFTMEQDTETTLDVTMTLDQARDLTRGLH